MGHSVEQPRCLSIAWASTDSRCGADPLDANEGQ